MLLPALDARIHPEIRIKPTGDPGPEDGVPGKINETARFQESTDQGKDDDVDEFEGDEFVGSEFVRKAGSDQLSFELDSVFVPNFFASDDVDDILGKKRSS